MNCSLNFFLSRRILTNTRKGRMFFVLFSVGDD
jgi:hypothetical protein